MIPSGLASLVVATIPVMIAMLETMLPGGEALNKRGWLGGLLGTPVMVALLWPKLHHPVANRIQMFAFGLRGGGGGGGGGGGDIYIAGLAFAVGSVLVADASASRRICSWRQHGRSPLQEL